MIHLLGLCYVASCFLTAASVGLLGHESGAKSKDEVAIDHSGKTSLMRKELRSHELNFLVKGPDLIEACTSALFQEKQALRDKGISIPKNGAGFASGNIEGGSTTEEFQFLGDLFQQELTKVKGTTVCQTGFNYGTSAYAFLCLTTAAKVYSWDLGEHYYVNAAAEGIDKAFPSRHVLTLGDSHVKLQESIDGNGPMQPGELCNAIFVDGDHSRKGAYADIEHFAKLSAPGTLLVIDDCDVDGKSIGGNMVEVADAFRDAVAKGIIVNTPELVQTLRETADDSSGRALCIGRTAS